MHPLALASPFFAEFDLRARGVTLAVPEISYGNPLPGRPAAIGYRDLDRTCAELDDGASWRRLLGPLSADCDGVVGLLLGDKRSLPPSIPAALRVGLRLLQQGTPGVAAAARRGRPRTVHRRCRTHDFADAVAGVLGRRADARPRSAMRWAGRSRSAAPRPSPTR